MTVTHDGTTAPLGDEPELDETGAPVTTDAVVADDAPAAVAASPGA